MTVVFVSVTGTVFIVDLDVMVVDVTAHPVSGKMFLGAHISSPGHVVVVIKTVLVV